MPRSKAQYKAPLTFTEIITDSLRTGVEPKVRDFSPALHGRLRKLYASKARSERASSAWQCPTCQFIEEILGAVRFAFAELDYQRSATNKGDTKAEQENLTKRLRASINKIKKKPNVARGSGFTDLAHDLRRISPDLYRLLEADADPRSCAGVLERFGVGSESADDVIKALTTLLSHVEAVKEVVKEVPDKLREREIQHDIAIRMAQDVIPILERNGLSSSVYASISYAGSSDAVKVLQAIGDDIGIVFAQTTWRDVVSTAQQMG